MYQPEPDKPLLPTRRPASAWERQAAREAELRARIEKLESLVDEVLAALERARIPRFPNGTPDA